MNASLTNNRRRIVSIDALRGLVMLIMLMDHVRETIYLHLQVGDPVDVTTTSPLLTIMRLLSSFCAPAFVLLAGTSAFLYQQNHTKSQTAKFLFTRGLFLIALELIVIGFAWTGTFPPEKFYLQIIWCIGISMICLSALIYLPKLFQIVLVIVLIAGHNLLDSVKLGSDHTFHFFWAILHQRDWIEIFGIPARTSYPVLPWIGVILLGYVIGSWFTSLEARKRQQRLLYLSSSMLIGFLILRGINRYGDMPWSVHDSTLQTILGFFCLTKYPASLAFLSFTIAFAGFLLILCERHSHRISMLKLADIGSGAMFFYIIHLYLLKILYMILVSIYGLNQGDYFGVNHPIWVILTTVVLSIPLSWITIKFVRYKERNRQIKWLSYI